MTALIPWEGCEVQTISGVKEWADTTQRHCFLQPIRWLKRTHITITLFHVTLNFWTQTPYQGLSMYWHYTISFILSIKVHSTITTPWCWNNDGMTPRSLPRWLSPSMGQISKDTSRRILFIWRETSKIMKDKIGVQNNWMCIRPGKFLHWSLWVLWCVSHRWWPPQLICYDTGLAIWYWLC